MPPGFNIRPSPDHEILLPVLSMFQFNVVRRGREIESGSDHEEGPIVGKRLKLGVAGKQCLCATPDSVGVDFKFSPGRHYDEPKVSAVYCGGFPDKHHRGGD